MTDIVARIQAQNYLASSRSRFFAGLQQRVLISIILPATVLMTALCCVAQNNDGPAELPRVTVSSAMSDTPAPGTVISLKAGDNLQSALNSATCGETIQLQKGATFTGRFIFPARSCDDHHWIIVRTSAADSALPAEGSRLTPCYAGVSSLPGRPAFKCASANNVLAKVVMKSVNAAGPIAFAPGANHYRLLGLEITRLQSAPLVYSLASVESKGTMNHIVFDRVWMHGTAHDDTTRGVELGGSADIAIVDSFFTDFHCTAARNSCEDAQAIIGGLGTNPMGPYKIVDNFLEASGENILFGGGAATTTPADIEIRQNHLFKPLTWMKGQAGYVGGANGAPFVVKNLLELKNAQRVLIDGNIMENSWGDAQVGFAILLTPKDQGNRCPLCQVTDVTLRNTFITHVGAGLQIANGLSDSGGPPLAGERYSIHDVIIDDINGVKFQGPGSFAQISVGSGAPLLQDVSISHVTAFPPSTILYVGDHLASTPRMNNFVFTNSIVNAGPNPIWSTGGGTANCAFHDSPLLTFNACFTSYSVAANAVIAPGFRATEAYWPAGNFFPATAAEVQFANYKGGNGGDYHLQSSSPYKGKGTDGKDLGADVDAVDSATAGVQ
ncbi:MAG TPA: hypothetical protein VMU26_16295 [Candidatus Polarisedimenticolia bacterium]|nr:hypothetical protein [Candidatus Polarisedimenticolia bacterium]